MYFSDPRKLKINKDFYSPVKTDLKALYGLPKKVMFCKSCVVSNQRPNSTVEFKNNPKKKKKKQLILIMNKYVMLVRLMN